jgi:hypothetical protein
LHLLVFVEVNMMERTWWESIGGDRSQSLERLRSLMREGRVRRVVVEDNRRAIADFPVTATDVPTASAMLGAISNLTTTVPGCTIETELADLEASRVAEMLTTTP